FTLLLSGVAIFCSGQARVVLNGAYMVMNGGTKASPIYLVVDNSATTALSNAATADSLKGGIITESEFNQVLWNIGNNTGTYKVFFCNQYAYAAYQLPLTYQITTGGTPNGAKGSIAFSTYGGEAAEGGSIPNEYHNSL